MFGRGTPFHCEWLRAAVSWSYHSYFATGGAGINAPYEYNCDEGSTGKILLITPGKEV
jgi:hypothetical protein